MLKTRGRCFGWPFPYSALLPPKSGDPLKVWGPGSKVLLAPQPQPLNLGSSAWELQGAGLEWKVSINTLVLQGPDWGA